MTKTILASVVIDEGSKIETGAESAQSKMDALKSAYNQEASENLISQILDCLFANFQRYLICVSAVRNSSYFYKSIDPNEPTTDENVPLIDSFIEEGLDKSNRLVLLGKLELARHKKDTKMDLFV